MLVKHFLLVCFICIPHNLIDIYQVFKSTCPQIGSVAIIAKTTSSFPLLSFL